jgi:hypothetical protein
MASIVNNNGLRHIEVFCPDGQRRRLSLGRVNRRNAESVKVYIENIVGAIRTGAQLDHDTAGWLMQVDDKFHKRLVRMGLAETRKTTNAQLAKFCDDFIAAKPVKTNTRENLQQVRRWLVDFFGETRNLRNVTPPMPRSGATSCERRSARTRCDGISAAPASSGRTPFAAGWPSPTRSKA